MPKYTLPLRAPQSNPFDRRYRDVFPVQSRDQLPKQINLAQWLGPLRNQNIPGYGECSGESGAGAIDWLWRHDHGEDFTASSLWTYELERQVAHDLTQDVGATLEQTQYVLQRWGACSNALDPDTHADFLVNISPQMRQDAAQHRLADGLWCPTLNEILNALANPTKPTVVQLGIVVYPSFESPATMQSGIVPMPQLTERPLGGHATLGFGADLERELVFVRNSWGACYRTAIGDQSHGNFALPFSYFDSPKTFMDARAYYLTAV